MILTHLLYNYSSEANFTLKKKTQYPYKTSNTKHVQSTKRNGSACEFENRRPNLNMTLMK